jgi:Ni/Fe-hydrogenase subunit HybB-like protein
MSVIAATSPRSEERNVFVLLALGGVLVAAGAWASYYMHSHGHAVTGMTNQVVWGVPHVFAIFMIVAASGVLNVASVGSVFGKAVYKSRAKLSGLLSLALLAGGLTVLMLDLGRPDRVMIAATHYNLTSVFAWNVVLYSGLFGIVALYLWTMMERRMNRYSKYAGVAAFVWRFVLTTGTGVIFAFLVARQAYQSAILAPMFIVMSLAWGMAIFLLAQAGVFAWHRRVVDVAVARRMARLLSLFVLAVLYFVIVYHLTNLYFARQTAFERFILVDGGIFPVLFWGGYVLLGTVAPLVLLYHPACANNSRSLLIACALVLVGAFANLYVFIIGGQAFPLELFPGYEVSSSFFDGAIEYYRPSFPEIVLGLGGVGLAFAATVLGLRVLPFMRVDEVVASDAAAARMD